MVTGPKMVALQPVGIVKYLALRRIVAKDVEAKVRAVPRDWCRAVKPAVGDQVVFTTKRTKTTLD